MNDNFNLEYSAHFRGFDWDKAKAFYYVSKIGSFTNASHFLNISQPALSRQISSLEQRLGHPLFIRQSRGLALTRKGEELQRIIKTTFEQMKEFTDNAKKTERGKKRIIRIGINKGIVFMVIKALESYQESHPYLTFELAEDLSLKEMVELDLDIAVCPFQKNKERLEQRPFLTIDKKLLFSKNLILSHQKKETIDLFFVTPAHLKDDEEIEGIYQTLLSNVTK